jgi:alanyl-tRNA synthetase
VGGEALTERIYYRNASVREFRATVLSALRSGGKMLIELDRTAFYPTSGGQPHDVGTIGSANVVDVLDSGDAIQHVVEGTAPTVGSEVIGRIDDKRRVDHTQQHSGQHVLSQSFEKAGKLQTVSFHLGAETSTIDLDQPTINSATVRVAEDIANGIVFDDRLVVIHFASANEIERFALRKPTDREGEVRIVDVEGFDRSACGGTHVERTGQIGPIKVRRWERRGPTTRIEFVCGWRALRDYTLRLETTHAVAERLSVADHEVSDAVFRVVDELKKANDQLDRLRDSLLDAEADRLASGATTIPNNSSIRLVRQSFVDRSPDELKRLALRLVMGSPTVVLLGSSGARTNLLFAQSTGLPYDLARILRDVAHLAGARGGGTLNLAQGGGPASTLVDTVLDAAVRLL